MEKPNLIKTFSLMLACMICFIPLYGWADDAVELRTVATITGTVTDEGGSPLAGATVLAKGTTQGSLTDDQGKYQITVDDKVTTLIYSYVGFATQEVQIAGRTVVNVEMIAEDSYLEEVVVTGYTTERKADIIGSVAVINTEDMLTSTSASLTGQLQGRASGVVVSNDSRPGNGAKVRIRGFTSFGSSNPLYIIDGVPTKDPTKVNPNDIASVQVLKDATAASIYGARAAQGVIIITTKGGSAGPIRLSYDGYYGVQNIPKSSIPDVLNTQEYVEYLQKNNGPSFIHPVFGSMSNPTIPDRIVVSPSFKGGVSAGDPRAADNLYDISDFGSAYQIMETSAGTNWFEAALRPAVIQNHQLSASGGSESSAYSFSLNYFGQEGMYEHTNYNRYAARMNTRFEPKPWLTVGENFQFIYDKNEGGSAGSGGRLGEQSPWAWAYRMVPYIPIYDIGGGFGGNAVGESGNATNPVAVITRDKDDYLERYKAFGNAFAEIRPVEGLTFRTSFGIDFGYFFGRDITYRTYESSENTSITGYGTNSNYGLTWTWTNTATYERSFGDHDVKLLAGTEAISLSGNGISVGTNTFDFEDPNFINLNTDQFSTPSTSSSQPIPEKLASYFGRIDYILADKYLFNATVRRDGTSKIFQTERFGIFPSLGIGWRLSEENFISNLGIFDDLKLRAGWGRMGSIDNVNAGNQFTLFGSNVGTSWYDINRTNNGAVVGYTPYRAGSLVTKWEQSETTNVGLDASFGQGKWIFSANYFVNNTIDLLITKIKAPTEPQVLQPSINLGKMQNKGFEFSLTNRNSFGDFEYDATLLFTHYTNEVQDIDGNPETFFTRDASRLSNVVRTSVGQPVSYFWGFELDGFFDTEGELSEVQQADAVVGSWRYKDQNGDGIINDDDQVKLGSPHPDFISSLNLDLRYKAFDFNMFWFLNYGNELFNYNKYFTDIRVFVGGVSKRVLENGWTPENTDALLPRLAPGVESGYTSFTRSSSNSYYIESGTFLRLRTMQLGYNFTPSVLNSIGLREARIYVQGQNLLTITNYGGPDPDINISGENPGDDLKMGVDESGFPTTRQILVGLNVSF